MDKAWDLLKEYDFLSSNSVNVDFVCIFCKKILIDPRICPCGCKYCKICIENYLSNGENICPGTTDECKEEQLDLLSNINIDHYVIKKMSKLILNCPIENCQYSDQLINMKQHLIGCRENAFKCSFSNNGCNFISLSAENVDKHYQTSRDKHLELVLAENENMKNNNNFLKKIQLELQQENDVLKKTNEKSKTEIDDYKNKLKQNEETITNLRKENNNQLMEITNYKRRNENEINIKNSLMTYLTDYFAENETEFIWTFDNLSEMNRQHKTVYSDEFFIFKKDVKMQLSLVNSDFRQYERGYNNYQINAILSFLDKSFYNCPLVCNITIGIININSQNFVSSYKGTLSFNQFSFEYMINHYDVNKFGINQLDYLMVKCIVNLSHSAV